MTQLVISIILVMVTTITIPLIMEYRSLKKKEAKHQAEEARRLELENKYGCLTKGLYKYGGDWVVKVEYSIYRDKFTIYYEHVWERLAVRAHIDLNGNVGDFYTKGGYRMKFLNKEHEDLFHKYLEILTGRIEDTNIGIIC